MDAYVGEIRIFCGTFAPSGWAFCDGSILNITQNTTLFSILGTVYGGNGTQTFGLPNLNGIAPIGTGQGPGLSSYVLGQTGGSTGYTLDQTTLPPHNHILSGSTDSGLQASPQGNYPAAITLGKTKINKYNDTANTQLNPLAIAPAGSPSPAPVSNMQPYLPLIYIIALAGVYPPRP
ncbi:Microcystin-dependent protein [Pedobacter westerhofensis]|uniref:Microcystin-dependent protein n=1 Tax=Pedobacter westerhofensis TaxID=425512 RepID=A0A521F6Y2_9SPHI|nr:tail fiber protein [Pedobacter westerhofensis]SMO91968.1 Microcystin-dependent protein [Pedobacter westerhofensis]